MSYKTLISPLICKHFDNPNETSSSIKEQLLLHSYICHLKTTVAEAYARLSLWLTTKIRGYLISRDISHFITRFSLYCSSIVWQATTKDKMQKSILKSWSKVASYLFMKCNNIFPHSNDWRYLKIKMKYTLLS